MPNDLDIFAGEDEAAFCDASLGGGRPAPDDDIDCITCIVARDRYAAGVL